MLLSVLAACGGGGGGGGDEAAGDQAGAPTVESSTTVATFVIRADRVKACGLVTSAEIQTAIGTAPVGEGAPLTKSVTHICRWKLSGTGKSFALAVNPESAAPVSPVTGGVRVSGVGDRAEFSATSTQAYLLVHVGDEILSIACVCSPVPAQAKLVDLARTAITRL